MMLTRRELFKFGNSQEKSTEPTERWTEIGRLEEFQPGTRAQFKYADKNFVVSSFAEGLCAYLSDKNETHLPLRTSCGKVEVDLNGSWPKNLILNLMTGEQQERSLE